MPQAECERGSGRDRPVETRSANGGVAARLDPASLDLAVLDANTMADKALQAELFQLYFDQAPIYLERMRGDLAAGEGEEWRAGAHGLKGTARTLGLIAVGDAAARCEQGAPAADRLAELEMLLESAQAAATDYIESS